MVHLDDDATIGHLVSKLKQLVSKEQLSLLKRKGHIVTLCGEPIITHCLGHSYTRLMQTAYIREMIRRREPLRFQLVFRDEGD